MLAGEARRKRLRDQRAAAGRVAVGGDRDADAGPAKGNAIIGPAGGDFLGELVAVIGIIDRIHARGPEVVDRMPLRAEPGDEIRLERDGGMIGSDGDPHGRIP